MIPVAIVPGQARHLVAEDDAHMAERDFRDQFLKAVPVLTAAGGQAQISIQDTNAVRAPAQLFSSLCELILVGLAFTVPFHLFGRRLPNAEISQTVQMRGGDFGRPTRDRDLIHDSVPRAGWA